MCDADSMISKGESTGAWPTALRFDELRTLGGLSVPRRALVATYAAHPEACLSVVGDRYRATTPEEWRSIVRAATAAGAKPTGAFALRDGSRVLATFEVGDSNGLRTNLVLADSFDGTMSLTGGFSSIRVVCANTLSTCMRTDGKGMAALRHTASLETKVNVLAESVSEAIKSGDAVRTAYHRAEAMKLSRPQAEAVFDRLFPSAPADADRAARTRADNARAEGMRAMARAENNAGGWLVDRTADGSARAVRGEGSSLDSMLFGARADRVEEIKNIVEVVMRDGTVEAVDASEALSMGCDAESVGRSMLSDILSRPVRAGKQI